MRKALFQQRNLIKLQHSRGVLIFSLNRTQILENSKRSKTAKILGIKQGPILCGQTRQETFGYTRSKKGVR